MSDNVPVVKGKYYLWLVDANDANSYIGNGVYLMKQDKNGGWDDALGRFALADIKMDGRKAPKLESLLMDRLNLKLALVKKSGKTDAIMPQCLTYTKFMEQLMAEGILPVPPSQLRPTISAEENVFQDSQQIDQEPESQDMGTTEGNSQYDEDYQEESQSMLIDGDDLPTQDFNKLLEKYNRQTTEVNYLLDKNLLLEEKLASGQTEQSDLISSSVRGIIQNSLETISESVENTVKREVRNGIAAFQVPCEQMLQNLKTDVENIDTVLNDIDTGLRSVLVDLPNAQLAIDGVSQSCRAISRTTTEIKAAFTNNSESYNRNTSPNANSIGQNRGSSSSSSSISSRRSLNDSSINSRRSLNDSGFQEKAVTFKHAKKTCTYCMAEGHTFNLCPERPLGYYCIRCMRENHKVERCHSLKISCTTCGHKGHDTKLHKIQDPAKRMKIMSKFGVELFPEFLGGTPAPNPPVRNNAPTTQVWLHAPKPFKQF